MLISETLEQKRLNTQTHRAEQKQCKSFKPTFIFVILTYKWEHVKVAQLENEGSPAALKKCNLSKKESCFGFIAKIKVHQVDSTTRRYCCCFF